MSRVDYGVRDLLLGWEVTLALPERFHLELRITDGVAVGGDRD
jgi:hypothetical protein